MTIVSQILGRRMRLIEPETLDVTHERDLSVPAHDGVVLLTDESHGRTSRWGMADRKERQILRLRSRELLDQRSECVVHPFNDWAGGPKILGELLPRADEFVTRGEKGADVGTPEAVDRLLRVPDEEQAAGFDSDRPPILLAG